MSLSSHTVIGQRCSFGCCGPKPGAVTKKYRNRLARRRADRADRADRTD